MRSLAVLALLAAAALAGGCRKRDPISHYKVPKEPTWRMLAAIIPREDQTWFFKAVGPGAVLGSYKEEFGKLLASVKFIDGKPQWTLPEGWKEEKGAGERLATLKFGKAGQSLELAVSSLQGTAGGILANINRWRGQMGLQGIEGGDLTNETTAVDVGGARATVVDLEGPNRPGTGPMSGGRAMPPDHPETATPDREPFTFELPQGWVRNPHPKLGGRIEFLAGEARVSITGMDGEAGGLAANVNRWRGQIGLEPVDEAGAEKLVQPAAFLGGEGMSIELVTSEKGLLCVFFLHPSGSVFVKMDGPAREVEKEKRAFQDFVRSLKLKKKNG